MRSILAVVTGSEMDRAVLDAAFAVGRSFASRIEVFHPRYDPTLGVPLVGDGMMGFSLTDIMGTLEAQSRRQAERARQTFDAWRAERGVPAAEAEGVKGLCTLWRELTGAPSELVTLRGRLADLIVIERPGHPEHDTSLIGETALFDSGRPVLCAPAGASDTLPSRMAVLWNGSAQAARAVGDALPLLMRAESVAVICLDENGDLEGPSAADLVDQLKLHGARALAQSIQRGGDDEPVALLKAAMAFGAGLIVMGAYGHSRFRELILGGVTRHVLAHSTVPVLMAR
ncbi:MAG: universal stress protein [Rhodospirillaceae bacterium]|nr:universal stress protein [Rhodospirillaceae bacterium]